MVIRSTTLLLAMAILSPGGLAAIALDQTVPGRPRTGG